MVAVGDAHEKIEESAVNGGVAKLLRTAEICRLGYSGEFPTDRPHRAMSQNEFAKVVKFSPALKTGKNLCTLRN